MWKLSIVPFLFLLSWGTCDGLTLKNEATNYDFLFPNQTKVANSTQNPDPLCVACVNLNYCSSLNWRLVETHNISQPKYKCEILESMGEMMYHKAIGLGKAFKDTPFCREAVLQYLCLFYGSNNDMYENNCIYQESFSEFLAPRPPCRSFCTQIANECSNDPDSFITTCADITCPQDDFACMHDPVINNVLLDKQLGCDMTLMRPSGRPTPSPLVDSPTLSFSVSLTLFGLNSQELDPAAQSSVSDAAAMSMALETSQVTYSGSSEPTETSSRRRRLVNETSAPVFAPTAMPLAAYSLTAYLDVIVLLDTDGLTAADLYTNLTTALTEAMDSGVFVQHLNTVKGTYGSDVTVSSSSVVVSTAQVAAAPSAEPTATPKSAAKLSTGAVVGIVVGAAAAFLLLLLLVWYVQRVAKARRAKSMQVAVSNSSSHKA